ncbi:MAG: class II aldolase/adducin family protein [Candidatus Binatia bacterium]
MISENILREKLATCTRIFAMEGMLGVFGHVSIYQPESGRILITPGGASDKATTQAAELLAVDLSGHVLDGANQLPIEWPIHTALHRAREDALAVAHLHAPYSTLFAIARREFRPVTLQGAIFGEGVPLYTEANLIKTATQSQRLAAVLGDKRAARLRGHGIVVVGQDIEEMLFASLVLEDDSHKAMQAATLGELEFISPEECRAFEAHVNLRRRAHRAWHYFATLESRWDRQPGTSAGPLA